MKKLLCKFGFHEWKHRHILERDYRICLVCAESQVRRLPESFDDGIMD